MKKESRTLFLGLTAARTVGAVLGSFLLLAFLLGLALRQSPAAENDATAAFGVT